MLFPQSLFLSHCVGCILDHTTHSFIARRFLWHEKRVGLFLYHYIRTGESGAFPFCCFPSVSSENFRDGHKDTSKGDDREEGVA